MLYTSLIKNKTYPDLAAVVVKIEFILILLEISERFANSEEFIGV